jgi:hypothetical protein
MAAKAMTQERYKDIAYALLKNQILGDMTLRRLAKTNGDDLKKRIGYLAQETGFSREEILEFIQVFYKTEIDSVVQKVGVTIEKISFSK